MYNFVFIRFFRRPPSLVEADERRNYIVLVASSSHSTTPTQFEFVSRQPCGTLLANNPASLNPFVLWSDEFNIKPQINRLDP
jgi:hypothetical protein